MNNTNNMNNTNYKIIKEMFKSDDLQSLKISSDIYNMAFIKNLELSLLKNNNKINYSTESHSLSPLNSDKKPLSLYYLLFESMKKADDLCSFFNFCPEFNNYIEFKNWYIYHQRYIDIEKLKKYIKNTTNKSVKRIGDMMFNPSLERIKIHEMLYNSDFISLDIQENYEMNDLILEIYKIPELNLDMYLYRYPDDNIHYIGVITGILNMMKNLVELYGIKSTHLELTFFASDQKKLVPLYNEPLTPTNTNSGYSYPTKSIGIWRKEEFIKVLIHELIHFYNIDFFSSTSGYSDLSKTIDSHIKLDIDIDSIDSCNESYTEALALVIHSYVISKLLNYDFVKILNTEICFTAFQVSKILNHHGYTNIRDIFRIKLKQFTSVRSYFIVKFIILSNLKEFLTLVNETKLKISPKLKEYTDFIQSSINNRRYFFDNTSFISYIRKNPDMNICKTMRMTLHDLFL